jgi:hypothetical protein
MPDFEHFLLPQPFSKLAKAAQGGPVVMLNASHLLGCDAVVIRSQDSSAEYVGLPGMTFEKLKNLKAQLWSKTCSDTLRHMGHETKTTGLNHEFGKILEELWTLVARPVIDHLGLKVIAGFDHVVST